MDTFNLISRYIIYLKGPIHRKILKKGICWMTLEVVDAKIRYLKTILYFFQPLFSSKADVYVCVLHVFFVNCVMQSWLIVFIYFMACLNENTTRFHY